MQEQKKTGILDDARGLLALILWWARVHASPCEVLLRRWGTFGSRYLGLPALMAIPYIVVFCAFLPIGPRTPPQPVKQGPFGYQQYDFTRQDVPVKPPEDHSFGLLGPAGVLLFLALYIAALLIHRVKGMQLRSNGYEAHSMSNGEKRFEKTEAAVCSFLGLMVLPLSVPVGIYLFLGGLAIAINEQAIWMHDNARIRAMKDSRIEAQYYAERLKDEDY